MEKYFGWAFIESSLGGSDLYYRNAFIESLIRIFTIKRDKRKRFFVVLDFILLTN